MKIGEVWEELTKYLRSIFGKREERSRVLEEVYYQGKINEGKGERGVWKLNSWQRKEKKGDFNIKNIGNGNLRNRWEE